VFAYSFPNELSGLMDSQFVCIREATTSDDLPYRFGAPCRTVVAGLPQLKVYDFTYQWISVPHS
jgi:hypothetical protein